MPATNISMTPNVTTNILPFVQGTRLWVTAPTGDWAQDNETGRGHADVLVDHIAEHGPPTLLAWVAKAIVEHGAWTGVEVGFFHRIAERAVGS